jgi:TonB-linked SusC/RagA family outer membrane protein
MKCKHAFQKQFWCLMKLTFLQVFLFAFFADMASALPAKGQELLNQRITVSILDKKVKEVLHILEKKTEMKFVYSSRLIDAGRTVSLQVVNTTVGEALDKLLVPLELEYALAGRQIVLSRKMSKANVSNLPLAPVLRQVSGKVVDDNGDALPGVSILVKGTQQGTTSDATGSFSINLPDEVSVLVFSFVGYVLQEIAVTTETYLNVSMKEDVAVLEEMVVVGYGTQKKSNLTGAMDVIKSDALSGRVVTNVSEALQGISPNLNITQSGTSGEPGGKLNMNIRGIGSLTGDSSPYVLVDGVPMDINSVNPNDIESLSVLKDAAASAIYGSRAPYGVILITTKKGARGEQKPRISYSNNFSLSSPLGLPHMTNSLNFVTAYDQASVNAGLSPNFSEYNIQRIKDYMAGRITEETWELPDGSDWAGNGIWDIAGNGNNDWLHIFYKDQVLRQKHDFSISGGGKKNSYFISAGYWDQPGELRFGDQFYRRYNLTANVSSDVTDWLKFELNTKYVNENFQFFNTTSGWDRTTMYHNFARTNVFRPMHLPNGEYSQISNIPLLNGGKEVKNAQSYIARVSGTLEPVKNWKTTVSYNYKVDFTGINDNRATVMGGYPNGTSVAVAYPISSYVMSKNSNNYKLFNAVTSYEQILGDHTLFGLLGYEREENKLEGLWGQKDNILTGNVPSISTATGQIYLDDEHSQWATQGVFGRLQYNYKEKYLLEGNVRYDGSSRFREGNRWGWFPSFSAGYNVSKESYWEAIRPVVNDLKLRASWGRLGNQNVGSFLHMETMGIGTNLGWIMGSERPNYTTAPAMISPSLTWETSETRNFGADATFLDGKLTAGFDVYKRLTSNMFGPAEALPIVLGARAPQKNNASLETSGFELSLEWRQTLTTDLSYYSRLAFSDNKSVVTQYNNPTKTLSTWYEGQQLGEIWGLKTAGIYQSDEEASRGPDQSLFFPTWGAGDIQYQDLDGDNKITRGAGTASAPGDFIKIGNSSPRYLFGLTLGGKWKGFDLRVFVQAVGKRDFAFGAGEMLFWGFNAQQWWNMTVMEQHLDYWRPSSEQNLLGANTSAYYPKPYLSLEDVKNRQVQSRYLQNAAYVRLKNVSISYSVPDVLLRKIGVISGLSVVVSGENLATVTGLTKLFDPEALSTIGWGAGKIHPLRRVYSAGINVNF